MSRITKASKTSSSISIKKEDLREKKLFDVYLNNQNSGKSLSHFFCDNIDILSHTPSRKCFKIDNGNTGVMC